MSSPLPSSAHQNNHKKRGKGGAGAEKREEKKKKSHKCDFSFPLDSRPVAPITGCKMKNGALRRAKLGIERRTQAGRERRGSERKHQAEKSQTNTDTIDFKRHQLFGYVFPVIFSDVIGCVMFK